MSAESNMQMMMAETARVFVEHTMLDAENQFGLLALSSCFPGGNGKDRWVAHHWTAKQKHIRPQPVPEAVDYRRVSGAIMSNDPSHNLAIWFVGKRPSSSRLSVKMFALTEDPRVLSEQQSLEEWVKDQMAFYAGDSSTEEKGDGSRPALGRGGWLKRLAGRNSR